MTAPASPRNAPPTALSDTIVILDDEPANATLVERMLARIGYTNVQATTDGAIVLSCCEDSHPDLLIRDGDDWRSLSRHRGASCVGRCPCLPGQALRIRRVQARRGQTDDSRRKRAGMTATERHLPHVVSHAVAP